MWNATGVLIVGVIISVVSTLVRLNARALAWPDSYSFSGPMEATTWYATQLAVIDVSNHFLTFGLVLVAAAMIREVFAKNGAAVRP